MGVPEFFDKSPGELRDMVKKGDSETRRKALYELFLRGESYYLKGIYKNNINSEVTRRAGEYLEQLGYDLSKI